MKSGLKISFRGVESLDHVSAYIEKKHDRLRRKRADLISCQVVVDHPHRSHRSGSDYRVSVYLTIPGREIIARSREGDGDEGADIFQAVNEAFGALEHQLRGAKRRRGAGKQDLAELFDFEDAVSPRRVLALN